MPEADKSDLEKRLNNMYALWRKAGFIDMGIPYIEREQTKEGIPVSKLRSPAPQD
jgi:hypothetical protein